MIYRNEIDLKLQKYSSYYSSYTVNMAWLKSSITEPQQLEYFKLVFLVILNVPIRMVFAETVTYISNAYTNHKLITKLYSTSNNYYHTNLTC